MQVGKGYTASRGQVWPSSLMGSPHIRRPSLSSAAAEMYALLEACKDAKLRYWISEDMVYMEQWPAVIKVDNAAAISFQQATKTNTKLKGVYNLRDKWVQELRDDSMHHFELVGCDY